MSQEEDLKKKFLEQIEKIKKDPNILVRGAIKMVVATSVSTTAVLIIKNLIPDDTELSRKKKVELYIGAWALGGLAADRAGDWAADNSLFSTLTCAVTDGIMSGLGLTKNAEETSDETETPTE